MWLQKAELLEINKYFHLFFSRYPDIISEKSTEALWQYLAAFDSTAQGFHFLLFLDDFLGSNILYFDKKEEECFNVFRLLKDFFYSISYLHIISFFTPEQVIEKYGGVNEEVCEKKLTLKSKPVFPLDNLGIHQSMVVFLSCPGF